jgi:hypothetical protein
VVSIHPAAADREHVAHQIPPPNAPNEPNALVSSAGGTDHDGPAAEPPGRSVVAKLRIRVVVAALVAFVAFRYVLRPVGRWVVDRVTG